MTGSRAHAATAPRPAAARRGGPASSRPVRRRSTCTPTRPAPTGSSRPPTLVRAAADVGVRTVRADRPRHARRLPRGRGRRRGPGGADPHPGRRDQRHRHARPRAVGGRAAHPRVRAWTRPTTRSRRRSPASATGVAMRFARTVERLRELGLPIDAQVAALDGTDGDDALGRPTVARALIAAGLRRERRGRLPPAARLGQPGLRAARGPRPGRGDRRHPRRRRPRRRSRTSPRRPRGSPSCRELVDAGLGGLEVYYRSFDAATVEAVGAVAATLGLVPTGGTDYHGDLEPYAEAHAAAVGPARGRRRRPRGSGVGVGSPATTDDRPPDASTRALPMLEIVPPAPRPARPAPPARARRRPPRPSTCPRRGRCRGSTSGRSAAR